MGFCSVFFLILFMVYILVWFGMVLGWFCTGSGLFLGWFWVGFKAGSGLVLGLLLSMVLGWFWVFFMVSGLVLDGSGLVLHWY